MGLKRSIKIKSSIIAAESALDVERAAIKETTPAAMPPCFDRWCGRFDNCFKSDRSVAGRVRSLMQSLLLHRLIMGNAPYLGAAEKVFRGGKKYLNFTPDPSNGRHFLRSKKSKSLIQQGF